MINRHFSILFDVLLLLFVINSKIFSKIVALVAKNLENTTEESEHVELAR